MTVAKTCIYLLTVLALIMVIIHVLLALTNSTTFEFAKASHLDYMQGMDAMAMPFSKGNMCANLKAFVQRDDCFQPFMFRPGARRHDNDETVHQASAWTPIDWSLPTVAPRDSEDWWNHPWRNKYWSCC
ncbi:hypothetical protein MPSEU_000024100 [Mayamaea pseudoterrestris]|nr:hypothetical protein MPSEU_000024100 [Mayamaea pseudoterrestris]